jgi:hypothetical protein
MFGEASGERPFRLCAFLSRRLASYGFALGRDAGELEREQAAQRCLLVGIGFEELLGAACKHAAEVDCLGRHTQGGVAAPDHGGPHVGQEIGEQRQCTWLGRGRCSDAVGGLTVLETDGQGTGWCGHDLVELRAVKRRDVDMLMALEERLIRL